MAELAVGSKAPEFSLPGFDGEEVSLMSLSGEKGLILYFYPKDNTAGCTAEAQAFRDRLADIEALGYKVVGVSRDSVKSHCSFRDKHELNFPLLSDKDELACGLYDVIKEKVMCGRQCRGIERSTFVIDSSGVLTHVFRGVKAKTHVEELYAELAK